MCPWETSEEKLIQTHPHTHTHTHTVYSYVCTYWFPVMIHTGKRISILGHQRELQYTHSKHNNTLCYWFIADAEYRDKMIRSPVRCSLPQHCSAVDSYALYLHRLNNRCIQKVKWMKQLRIFRDNFFTVRRQNIINPLTHSTNIKSSFHSALTCFSYPECP